MSHILLIVESPAKCPKIESFLGNKYKCVASFGHLRELNSLKNIDINNNFKATYEVVNDNKKKAHIKTLKRQIKDASEVILATDDDREGEAIAWHICMLFNLSLTSTKRIIFHEITEKAIKHAISNPTIIDLNKVYAQQSRQILDILVGFKISPILWEKIVKKKENSLSAGRCQTPALRLIYDNQIEIDNNPGDKVYNTIGYFTNKCISFELNIHHTDQEEMYIFLENTSDFSHVFNKSERKRTEKKPPQPFTTSRLQQQASNEMRCSPKETMRICQKLYEGGYITYMRTDSKKYSKEFINETKKYILENYNDMKYINPEIDNYISESNENESSNESNESNESKKTNKNNKNTKNKKDEVTPQEAHEAIRPTNVYLKQVPSEMTSKEQKMYRLIRENSIESCMSSAEYWAFKCSINGYKESKYIKNCELLDFLGWKAVKNNDKNDKNDLEYHYLSSLDNNFNLSFLKICSTLTLKNCKQHYTEAKLVQLLEDKGIGRPSTYSMLVDKIQERKYVSKKDVQGKEIECIDFELDNDYTIEEKVSKREFGNEKNKLVLEPLGKIVIEFLIEHFNNIFSYGYTKEMEDKLDEINKGKLKSELVCKECLNEIETSCNELDLNKINIPIDENHFYIIGKHGPVIKCIDCKKISFKAVKKDLDLTKIRNNEYTLEDLLEVKEENSENDIGNYENNKIYVKKGKYGLFARWNDKTISLASLGNRPIANIRSEEVIEIIKSTNSSIIRVVDENTTIRKGKYGDYVYHKKSNMKKPIFFKLNEFEDDYKTCDVENILSWYKIKFSSP